MTALAAERAPAKVNLCLVLGPVRQDGRHELVTVFDSVTLCDELEVTSADEDEVVCEGVSGPNLVSDALAHLRGAGWDAPPVRVTIRKRIPVAAGMGGGSADAAAMLRAAGRLAPVPEATVRGIAERLGADVPSQLAPGPSLGTGAGEVVRPLAGVPPYGVLVIPQPFALSTADVYRESDRLALGRPAAELRSVAERLQAALPDSLPAELVVNDLQPAALSLAPAIAEALEAARRAGADHAMVCGSGPTVIGLFAGSAGDSGGSARAAAAAERVRAAHPLAVAAEPLRAGERPAAANE